MNLFMLASPRMMEKMRRYVQTMLVERCSKPHGGYVVPIDPRRLQMLCLGALSGQLLLRDMELVVPHSISGAASLPITIGPMEMVHCTRFDRRIQLVSPLAVTHKSSDQVLGVPFELDLRADSAT